MEDEEDTNPELPYEEIDPQNSGPQEDPAAPVDPAQRAADEAYEEYNTPANEFNYQPEVLDDPALSPIPEVEAPIEAAQPEVEDLETNTESAAIDVPDDVKAALAEDFDFAAEDGEEPGESSSDAPDVAESELDDSLPKETEFETALREFNFSDLASEEASEGDSGGQSFAEADMEHESTQDSFLRDHARQLQELNRFLEAERL